MRDRTLGDTFTIFFPSRFEGVPTTLAGSPGVYVIPGDSVTPITNGVTLSVDHAGIAGFNVVTIEATALNGFQDQMDYSLVVESGTVGGTTVAGEIIENFSLGLSASAVSVAALNDFDPASDTVALVAALSGHTPQTQDHTTAIAAIPTAEQNQAGLATSTDVAGILTTQLTESYAADGVAPTLSQSLMLIQQLLGDFAISGTTITVNQLDGATAAATYTLDSDTAPTSKTRET